MGKIANRFAAKRSPHQLPALRLAELMLEYEESVEAGLAPTAGVRGAAERIEAFGVQVHGVLEQPRAMADAVLAATRGFIAQQRGGNARVRQFSQLLEDLAARTYLRDAKNTKAQLFLMPAELAKASTDPLSAEDCAAASQRLFQQLAKQDPLGVAVFPISMDSVQWRAGGPAARFKLLKLFAQATANNRPLAAVAPLLVEACEFPASPAEQGPRWLPVCVWLKGEDPLVRDLKGTDLNTSAQVAAR